MEENPGEVLRRALSSAARAALAPELRGLVEEEESHEGLLEVFHADGPQGGAYHYALRKASGHRLALRFAGGGPNLLTGTSVRINGIRVEQALALGGAGSVEVLGLPVLPSTFGEHKVLVILLRFLDTPVTTASPVRGLGSDDDVRHDGLDGEQLLPGELVPADMAHGHGRRPAPPPDDRCELRLRQDRDARPAGTHDRGRHRPRAVPPRRLRVPHQRLPVVGTRERRGHARGGMGQRHALFRWSRRTSWVTTSGSITPTPSSAGRWPWAGRAAPSSTATSST